MIKVQLAGDVKRFNSGDKMYYAGTVYILDEGTANYLLDQYDNQTGFSYFEQYKGDLAGVKPDTATENDGEKVSRKERPVNNRRRAMGEAVQRVPRSGRADRPALSGSRIEEDDDGKVQV